MFGNSPYPRLYREHYFRKMFRGRHRLLFRSSASHAQTVFVFGTLGICAAAYFSLPRKSRSAPTSHREPMSASHFIPAVITSSEPSGPDTKLITMSVQSHLLPPRNSPALTPIWSVFIKDDDIQVERPYTPLEGIDNLGRMKFWIKRYPEGEVGRWLHLKKVGDTIELRGPLKTWNWQQDAWDEIVMVRNRLS